MIHTPYLRSIYSIHPYTRTVYYIIHIIPERDNQRYKCKSKIGSGWIIYTRARWKNLPKVGGMGENANKKIWRVAINNNLSLVFLYTVMSL